MTVRKYLVALLVTGAWLVLGGVASAAFPNYSDCPSSTPNFEGCLDIQGVSGNLRIKEFTVPLNDSLEIRGAVANEGVGRSTFVPPTGTTGLFAKPVSVPGGLLGIEWIPGTSVLALTELAGPPSGIRLDLGNFRVGIPVKVRLVNLLLGMDCHIGTDSRPVMLNLATERTNPPPPNTPITGSIGSGPRFVPPAELQVLGAVNVENSFAVPGATECGLGLGLINALVNLKLGLPSAAGNNSIEIKNNIGIRLTP
ncbi:MAG TPA: hypothetical protein VFF79_12125 [Conexibacter sp.]|jgi:hypothetical protein|nr:hypothetical protein [Conexibacter sp.]